MGELLGQPNKMLGRNLRWTSIPSRGVAILQVGVVLRKAPAVWASLAPIGFTLSKSSLKGLGQAIFVPVLSIFSNY